MGKIKNAMIGVLGLMTVTFVDAWSLNVDLVNSPFVDRLWFSAQKYIMGVTVPMVLWVIITWRGRKGE